MICDNPDFGRDRSENAGADQQRPASPPDLSNDDLHDTSRAIKTSIVVIVAAMAIAIWAAVTTSIYFSRVAALAEMKANATNLAFAFDDEVTHSLDISAGIMEALAGRMRAEGSDMNIHAWARQLPIISGPIIEAGIIAPNGMLIASTMKPDIKPIDVSDREHFRIHIDGAFKGLFIGKPMSSRLYNQIVIPISKRVEASDGRFIGVLVMLLSPAQLTKLYKSVNLGEQGTMTLIGLDRIIRARFSKNSPEGLANIGESLAGSMSQIDALGVNQGSYIQYDTSDHIRRIHSFRRVASYPVFVNVGLGYDQGMASWWKITETILAVAAGATLFLCGMGLFLSRAITARKVAEQEITHLARTDPLTGLPNRRVFVEALQQAIDRMSRGDKGFAVHYLDLDHFKDVNDTLGHMLGDELLKAVADRLRSTIRDTDVVARFGGDEFSVLQTDIETPADAAALAAKLIEAIARPFLLGGNTVQSGTSIGIAVSEAGRTDSETILSHADLALYRAKSQGRGAYRYFTEGMDQEVRARVELAGELRDAIATQQLFLEYQPQVEIETGRISGLEALVRWRHPQKGLLSPAHFVQVAENSGLIEGLGRLITDQACRQMKHWVDAGIAPETIAVNVSAVQLRSPLVLEREIMSILRETKLSPNRLEIELTETALMEKSNMQLEVLRRLRAVGIKLAIDDFGTGFSSLDYLRQLRVDRIKIAQVFMTDIAAKENDAIIVRATVALAHALRMRVIAEGVETREQVGLLRKWNCEHAQGFYYSRPLPADAVTELLRRSIGRSTVVAQRNVA